MRVLSGSLAVLLACSCAQVERGRYGVTAVEVRGAKRMDASAAEACLLTTARPWLTLRLGTRAPTCNEPPFDRSAPSLRVWRFPWSEWPSFNRAVLDDDVRRLLRWYRARGFYAARVTQVRVDPPRAAEESDCPTSDEPCTAQVTLEIEEGGPTTVRRVELVGIDRLPVALQRALHDALTLTAGTRFDEFDLERSQGALLEVLRSAAYANAQVKSDVQVTTSVRSAVVRYYVVTGQRFRFGQVQIRGHGELPSEVILGAANLAEGAPYDPAELKEVQAEVFALGGFSSVEARERIDAARGVVDVEVHVSRLAPTEFRVGAGLLSGAMRRTETGELSSVPQWDAHVFGSFERRNFLGTLGRLRVDERPRAIFNRDFPRLTPPKLGNAVGVGLTQPGWVERRTDAFFRTEWDYGPDAFLGFERSDVFFRAGLRRGFFTRKWVATLALQQDLYVVSSGAAFSSDGTPTPSSYGHRFLEQDLRVDLRDRPSRPRRGSYFGFNASEALRSAASDWTAFKLTQDSRAYLPLPLDIVLAARVGLAAAFVLDAARDLDVLSQQLGPAAYRLRGGGAYGNRGFLAGQLGAGPSGGLRRWESSLELRLPVGEDFGFVGFVDWGDVHAAPRFRFTHLNTSAGAGLRYFTLFGAVRLDAGLQLPGWQRVAASPNPDTTPARNVSHLPFTDAAGALHLTLGEAF